MSVLVNLLFLLIKSLLYTVWFEVLLVALGGSAPGPCSVAAGPCSAAAGPCSVSAGPCSAAAGPEAFA